MEGEERTERDYVDRSTVQERERGREMRESERADYSFWESPSAKSGSGGENNAS